MRARGACPEAICLPLMECTVQCQCHRSCQWVALLTAQRPWHPPPTGVQDGPLDVVQAAHVLPLHAGDARGTCRTGGMINRVPGLTIRGMDMEQMPGRPQSGNAAGKAQPESVPNPPMSVAVRCRTASMAAARCRWERSGAVGAAGAAACSNAGSAATPFSFAGARPAAAKTDAGGKTCRAAAAAASAATARSSRGSKPAVWRAASSRPSLLTAAALSGPAGTTPLDAAAPAIAACQAAGAPCGSQSGPAATPARLLCSSCWRWRWSGASSASS